MAAAGASSNILQINRPVAYIPGQTRSTCVADALETILCYADVVRHIFLDPFEAWLTPERAEGLSEFNEEYRAFIRDNYDNSAYVRNVLIRYLNRQTLELKPFTKGSELRRTASQNFSRGVFARYNLDQNVIRLNPTAFNDDVYENCTTNMAVIKKLLPGISIFPRNPPLRADWKETLVALNLLIWLHDPEHFHAISMIRNNGSWYLCDDAFGVAYQIPAEFTDHLVHSIVLGKRIEEIFKPGVGGYLVVNGVAVLDIPRDYNPETAHKGPLVVGSQKHVADNVGSARVDEYVKKAGSNDHVCFFVDSTAPLLTEADMGLLRIKADELQRDLIETKGPSPSIVWQQLYDAISNERIAEALHLIQSGADLRYKKYAENGLTILHLACKKGMEVVVGAILDSPLHKDVNAKDYDDNTPLMFAAEHDNVNLVRKLLQNGANINDKNKHAETTLCIACKFKNPRVALFLLDVEGIDFNQGNPMALIEEDEITMAPVKAVLLKKGANPEAETTYAYGDDSLRALDHQLYAAIHANDSTQAIRLLARGATYSTKALNEAIKKRLVGVTLELIKIAGSDINTDYKSRTPLGVAAMTGPVDLLEKLLEAGAGINGLSRDMYSSEQMSTPLYWACKWRREKEALFLIERGADVTISNPITLFRGDRMPTVKAALLAKGAKDPMDPAVAVAVAGGSRTRNKARKITKHRRRGQRKTKSRK